jgi:hypothetical protein
MAAERFEEVWQGRSAAAELPCVSLPVSAILAISPAVTFALFAQLILVETGRPQFLAHLLVRRLLTSPLLTRLAISPAVTFALFAQPILIFTGQSQLLTLAACSPTAIIYLDAARPNLERLGRGRNGKHKQGGRG